MTDAPRADAKRILVVEDDVDIREALIAILEDAGYVADGAGNGLEALDHLRGLAPKVPSLILLDLMMPIMNGRQLRAELLRDPVLAAIPVVVISADVDVGEKAAALGAASSMKKPIDIDTLLETTRRFCA